jgi:hypothetical protein
VGGVAAVVGCALAVAVVAAAVSAETSGVVAWGSLTVVLMVILF